MVRLIYRIHHQPFPQCHEIGPRYVSGVECIRIILSLTMVQGGGLTSVPNHLTPSCSLNFHRSDNTSKSWVTSRINYELGFAIMQRELMRNCLHALTSKRQTERNVCRSIPTKSDCRVFGPGVRDFVKIVLFSYIRGRCSEEGRKVA